MNNLSKLSLTFCVFSLCSSALIAQPLGAFTENVMSSRDLVSLLPGANNPKLFIRNEEGLIEVEGDMILRNHTIQKGQVVWDLLPEYGFESNQDIVGVMQALNPTVIDMERIKTGDHIRIPAVSGFDSSTNESQWIFEDSQPRQILVDTLNTNIENIEFTRGLSFNEAIFDEENPYEFARDTLTVTNAAVARLSPEFVNLINSQAKLVQDIATYMNQPTPEMVQNLLDDHQEKTLFLEKSEAELRELYSAARQTLTMTSEAIVYELPTYRRLTVNTLDNSGVFRCQLSVWHAPKSSLILGQLDRDKRRLTRLSNPADGSVPVSLRVFWAEWEGVVTSPYVEAKIFPGVSNHVIDINVGEGAHCQ